MASFSGLLRATRCESDELGRCQASSSGTSPTRRPLRTRPLAKQGQEQRAADLGRLGLLSCQLLRQPHEVRACGRLGFSGLTSPDGLGPRQAACLPTQGSAILASGFKLRLMQCSSAQAFARSLELLEQGLSARCTRVSPRFSTSQNLVNTARALSVVSYCGSAALILSGVFFLPTDTTASVVLRRSMRAPAASELRPIATRRLGGGDLGRVQLWGDIA